MSADILVVDDEVDIRELVAGLLEDEGYRTRKAGSADEALAAMGRKRRIVLTVNQFFTAGRVVSTSDLLTVLPRHFIDETGMSAALVFRELPFDVPRVHVDALWHHRQTHRDDHAWLREAVARAARRAFAGQQAA